MTGKKEKIEVSVIDVSGKKLFCVNGYEEVELEFERCYQAGDRIRIVIQEDGFLKIRLDESMEEAVVFGKEGVFDYLIPAGEEKEAYSPQAFMGEHHKIIVRHHVKDTGLVNLSQNVWDVRGKSAFYPHCTATVETRGEAVFAARNTIDGMTETKGHGMWPFTSWGEGEDADAEIRIDFGRPVLVEEVQIFLRADFPHDNYWKEAELVFSGGKSKKLSLEKTGEAQKFGIENILTEWVVMKNLKKDESDSSPFPALTQWVVLGRNV